MGVFTYTKNLSEVMNKSLSLLKPNGTFFIHSVFDKNFLKIYSNDSSLELVSFVDLLKSVPGLIVTQSSSGLAIKRTDSFVDGTFPPLTFKSLTGEVMPRREFILL